MASTTKNRARRSRASSKPVVTRTRRGDVAIALDMTIRELLKQGAHVHTKKRGDLPVQSDLREVGWLGFLARTMVYDAIESYSDPAERPHAPSRAYFEAAIVFCEMAIAEIAEHRKAWAAMGRGK